MLRNKILYTFLVVEDNAGDFMLIEDLLKEQFAKATITNATTFKQAIAFIEVIVKPYDAVLLDLSLPDKSGDELIKDMLKMADLTPIIVLTGNSNIDYSINAISLGVSDYLVKDDLTNKILHKSILYAINRKSILENLRAEEANLKKAQAIAHLSNWEIDLVQNSIKWSDELYNILEIKKDKTNPSTDLFFSFIHPDDIGIVRKDVSETQVNFSDTSSECRLLMKDGSIKYVFLQRKIELDNNKKPIRLYGTLQDITERKKTEKKQKKLTSDLIQRNRDLEQFTFIVSHNLRAPMANIMGIATILQDETLTTQEQKELLQGLSLSISGLDIIIKDINSILQVKDEVNEKKEIISFTKLVKNILNSIRTLIEKHDVIIKPDFSDVDEIFSLKVYMHSIFYNLIVNSIKYCKPDETPIIEIKSKKENEKLIITFKDNGLGIDMKTKGDKVFGLYKRFHTHVEGKGMGLFMVKTQVEALGGTITVASELNKGSEFTLTFIR